jgi:DNA-binding CsgD family transcriptional regulator
MTKKVLHRPIMGRPTKYDAKNNSKIIELMSEGASLKEVAVLLDISRETLYEWCNSILTIRAVA